MLVKFIITLLIFNYNTSIIVVISGQLAFLNTFFIKIKHTFVCLILSNEITQKFMLSRH